ncbi:MAG: DUF6765 family protein [bacterium]
MEKVVSTFYYVESWDKMQIDFHHAAIYVLSRLAGMKSKYAQKVAYSSQFVDDAVHAHALKFETYNYHKFTKKPDFTEADWTLFMRAAAIHKYRVLHKILPEAGLEVG